MYVVLFPVGPSHGYALPKQDIQILSYTIKALSSSLVAAILALDLWTIMIEVAVPDR
jgi:hypothetical protein